ncbi:hypothetical protein [Rhizobium sp. MHM7A]|uniref:hypothetical protein n=1 Tax=Rhizobium sp. MHM7A TaxID=2583233 RepID=UPI0011064445|nr:hypothetical protein [Rhizobium sp. MHM7A]TLX16606.1 hypothetical protein FFR93_04500 [Rhizobium sp. MHM7A]
MALRSSTFCAKQLLVRQLVQIHRTLGNMGKSKILKSFPRLQKAFQSAEDEDFRDQFESAMNTVSGFGEEKPYKVEVKAADNSLKELTDIAWQRLIKDPYAGDDAVDPDIKKLFLRLKHGSVEQIERSLTLLADSGKHGKVISAAWEVLKEIEGIHWSVFSASESAKKGTPPDLLSRGLGTCSCCFGEFHVRNEKMVRHGQRKIQDYMWSPTCYGVAYPPLEISTQGLEEFIGRYERGREQLIAEIADPEAIQTVPLKTKEGVGKLNRGEAGFDKALDAYVVKLKRDVQDMTADLEILRDRLEHWSSKLSNEPKGPGR